MPTCSEGQTAAVRVSKRRITRSCIPRHPRTVVGSGLGRFRCRFPSLLKGLLAHMDRPLTDAEVKAIDEALARYCYAEGLAFTSLASEDLRAR